MEIKIRKNDDDIYLVELSGSLDLYSAGQLKDLAMKMIEKRVERLIFSFTNVSNVSSAGIGALIYISSTLKKLNCPLAIIDPDGPVTQALDVTRLKGYFSVVSTLKEAVALVSPSA